MPSLLNFQNELKKGTAEVLILTPVTQHGLAQSNRPAHGLLHHLSI